MSARALATLMVALVACGDAEEPRTDRVKATYRASADGREVVAEVDGEPVYADCVERQARAHGLGVRAALDECIEFELLAAEARRRGYLSDPEVVEASRREAVRAFMDADFGIQGPEDLPVEKLRAVWEEPVLKIPMKKFFDHREVRRLSFCLVKVPGGAPEHGAEAFAAEASIRAVHAAVTARDMGAVEFMQTCRRFLPGKRRALTRGQPLTSRKIAKMSQEYADAVLALEEAGDVTLPVRTGPGWYITRLDGLRPEQHLSFEEALPELRRILWEGSPWFDRQPWPKLFREFRESLFREWYAQYHEQAEIETYPERIPESPVPTP